MPVLPGSVSTSPHPARDSVAAMRSAGKCGSIGRYTPPALNTARTAAIQSRLRSVTTATTSSRRSPRASSARASRLARALSSRVGPLPAAVHGRDVVRVRPHPLLEQLVDPAVRQLPARPGEPLDLEVQFLGGQQALPPVLGIRVGGDQRERGEVIAGDPGGAVRRRARRSGTAAAARARRRAPRSAPAARCPSSRCSPGAAAGRVEHRLERRPGQAELGPETGDREAWCAQQLRLGPVGVRAAAPATSRARPSAGRAAAGRRAATSRSPPRPRPTARRAPWRARPAAPS